MNKILQLIALLFIISYTQAQFNYQASLRDGDGILLENQNVSFRVSILDASSSEYEETHSVTTTKFGIVNFLIGEGTATNGDFSSLEWETKDYSLKVEVDIAGGTSYTNLGTNDLSVVPYANHANSSNMATVAETTAISENTNGVLSVTTIERDLIDLVEGKIVYNIDEKKFQGIVDSEGLPILDQEMTDLPNSGNAVDDTRPRTGQEFIATKTGVLSQVDVNVSSVATASSFNLVIYRGSSDYVNEIPAYTQSFNVTTAGYYEIVLDTPLPVEQNENLVWSVEYIDSGSIGIGRLSGDPYPNGRSCTFFSCGASCCDLNFRSYITTSGPTWIDLH